MEMAMRNFEDLRVWQAGHHLTLAVYRATALFPKAEQYGLTSQIRRATVSIEANLAEGCGRRTDPELHRFVQISMGSASELHCHLMIARDLGMLSQPTFNELAVQLTDVRKMLTGLVQTLSGVSKVASASA
jgi:four helix bundle protein